MAGVVPMGWTSLGTTGAGKSVPQALQIASALLMERGSGFGLGERRTQRWLLTSRIFVRRMAGLLLLARDSRELRERSNPRAKGSRGTREGVSPLPLARGYAGRKRAAVVATALPCVRQASPSSRLTRLSPAGGAGNVGVSLVSG